MEITPVVQVVASSLAGVGAIGSARLGVQVLVQAYQRLREAGLSAPVAMRQARKDFDAQQGPSSSDRQRMKETEERYHAMWAEQSKQKRG